MRQRNDGTFRRETGTCLIAAVLLVTIAVGLVGCKSKTAASAPASGAQPKLAMAEPIAVSAAAPRLTCPLLDSSPTTTPAVKGGHRVLLSWNASSRDTKHGTAVGYCLYRATAPNKRATERVNVVPFTGTKCVDDVVENGKKYSYVIRAISDRGITSLVSKPAPAVIPDSPANTANAATSAPMCREGQ